LRYEKEQHEGSGSAGCHTLGVCTSTYKAYYRRIEIACAVGIRTLELPPKPIYRKKALVEVKRSHMSKEASEAFMPDRATSKDFVSK
jgi:hypothetical protein